MYRRRRRVTNRVRPRRRVRRPGPRRRPLGVGRRRTRRRRYGGGVWDTIKSGFTSGYRRVKSGLSDANDWLKKTKVISQGANSLAKMGVYPQYTGAIGAIAGSLGYGRRRLRRRRRRGGCRF